MSTFDHNKGSRMGIMGVWFKLLSHDITHGRCNNNSLKSVTFYCAYTTRNCVSVWQNFQIRLLQLVLLASWYMKRKRINFVLEQSLAEEPFLEWIALPKCHYTICQWYQPVDIEFTWTAVKYPRNNHECNILIPGYTAKIGWNGHLYKHYLRNTSKRLTFINAIVLINVSSVNKVLPKMR